jgi:hypothetical protein
MDESQLNSWWPLEAQRQVVTRLLQRVGLTRVRAEYFVRLWIYILVKQKLEQTPTLKPPLQHLEIPVGFIPCTYREASAVFYGDKDQGSDRAAGLIIDKLAALNLIRKTFDGNTTSIEIQPLPEVSASPTPDATIPLKPDEFNPRCDAIPVANFLATNYNWMNRNFQATPQRIAKILRVWSQAYPTGLRVLRRCDNQNPVGFYLLYPVDSDSEKHFFKDPHRGLHFSADDTEVDPFVMAKSGDLNCSAIYVRSWMIEAPYIQVYQSLFLQDAQATLRKMQGDFPNICDLYSMVIHPGYETLAQMLGFQRMQHTSASIYWMYQALDRFLALDIDSL